MSERAVSYFVEGVESIIERCRQEWHMSYCEIVGCLEIIKSNLIEESLEDEDG